MVIELIRVADIKGHRTNLPLIIAISAVTFLLFSAVYAKAGLTGSPQVDTTNSSASRQTFTIYLENDGTFLKPEHRTDRHYTAGLKFVYTDQPDCNWLKRFARWNKFAPENEQVRTAVGYFLGQDIFTPDHVDKPALRSSHDRVFAGWLYGGVFIQRAKEDQMEHFELNLGVIGPSALAKEGQRDVHRLIGAERPHGWENQLNDEFAADFTYFKRQRADAITFKRTENFDSHIEYGFTAGSVHRNAILSVIFRGGVNLPNDFGPGRLEAPACATGKTRDDLTHLYLFTRLGGKLVEFDRFLTGLSEKPLVGVLQVGIGWRYKSFEMTYSQTFLTREYDEQPGEDSYGSLTASYRF